MSIVPHGIKLRFVEKIIGIERGNILRNPRYSECLVGFIRNGKAVRFKSRTHGSYNIRLPRKSGSSYVEIEGTVGECMLRCRYARVFLGFFRDTKSQIVPRCGIGDISIPVVECGSSIVQIRLSCFHAIVFFHKSEAHRNIRKNGNHISFYDADSRNLR
ncbi:MAG: hypothetical protein ACD_78C00140G0001 [uncultured bacterium (gcode 4)]|uniref:Uncharacterized protein n=1 Tax=uncultured bacterium (gcode 4) TaxID=1234023 RepID=K1XYZ5_9BACT|nr:MAG: hypothetical protein ACD_78C00140G0001 [uncultured bacterium (gcode 4)]